jgi:hypothetical protein
MADGQETGRVAWHPAFFDAIRAELAAYRDALDFRSEYQLNAEPLRIDVLVIKKKKGVVIEKNIGQIFRRVNIVEYKSPDDSLAVEDFYKVCGYAYVYRALDGEAEITDMSLSFVVEAYPRKLTAHLRDMLGYGVEEKNPGIHEISGGVMPMQIIESKRLPEDENLWLRSMTSGLSFEELHTVLRRKNEAAAVVGEMGAYLHALLEANSIVAGKGVRMLSAEFIEAVESTGLGDKWRAQGVKKGREEGIVEGVLKTARAMFLEGDSLEKIERVTNIPMERLRKELQTQ